MIKTNLDQNALEEHLTELCKEYPFTVVKVLERTEAGRLAMKVSESTRELKEVADSPKISGENPYQSIFE